MEIERKIFIIGLLFLIVCTIHAQHLGSALKIDWYQKADAVEILIPPIAGKSTNHVWVLKVTN